MLRPVHLLVLIFTVRGSVIDLNGDWTVCSSNGTCLKGTVPGDIFTDLYRAGLIPHPLKGDNSLALDWVSREKWTYSRNFSLTRGQLTNTVPALLFEGLDTVAQVYLNEERLLNTDNQFRRYALELTDLLTEKNRLEVRFESPVLNSQHKSEKYKDKAGHELPPVCPPDIYHGECHPNFIRKAQYSFSWDWGPSIPTVGLWRPVRLLLPSQPTPLSVSWITDNQENKWRVLGSLEYWNIPGEVECSVRVGDVGNSTFSLSGKETERLRRADFVVEAPVDQVEVWWPATEGNPKLYDFTVSCGQENSVKDVLKEEIGFRTVELIQDLVDATKPEKGRNFYFKINGKPVFLKGSNWIPASMFPGENTDKRVDFLLDSAVEANMNVLRVWGGGIYESEYFYRLANRKGLLLWQDMMFTCALYPTDKQFLTTVSDEVEEQVYRLRKHPSILVFAGNNENEVAIRTHWWSVENYSEKQEVDDYVVLYASTIAPIVKALDPSRPFLLSSPSNGLETEEEGGVAKNPGDVRFGDIHFYNEFVNLWQDYNYLTPRCASEYGIQSFPFRFAYYSQAHQAIMYKTQTEHYRRFRGKLTEDGRGNTMCALYWQLNDVWAAPTWSSVDFDLNWKMVQYEAKRFFAPIIVVLYSTEKDDLGVTIVNDGKKIEEETKVRILQFGWGSGFDPVYKKVKAVILPEGGVVDITFGKLELLDYDSEYVFAAELLDQQGSLLSPTTVLLPDKLFQSQLYLCGNVSIDDFKRIDDSTYSLTVVATDLSPLTWLSLQAANHPPFWFSDNGFTMITPRKSVVLKLREPFAVRQQQISVCNIKTCGL